MVGNSIRGGPCAEILIQLVSPSCVVMSSLFLNRSRMLLTLATAVDVANSASSAITTAIRCPGMCYVVTMAYYCLNYRKYQRRKATCTWQFQRSTADRNIFVNKKTITRTIFS